VERKRNKLTSSNTVIPYCRINPQVDYDRDYDWGQWNLAAKRRILMERPSGSAVFPNDLVAPYYVEHQQNTTNSAATLISSLASRNTQSDQSTVTDQMRVEGWDEMEEGSSGSLFHSLTELNYEANIDFESLDVGDGVTRNDGVLQSAVQRSSKSKPNNTVQGGTGILAATLSEEPQCEAEKVGSYSVNVK
jgi:hypothetical protein